MDINRSNYEIWLLDLLEGILSEKEAEEVTRFIEQNPDVRGEFENLRSPAPELGNYIFKDKKSIRKSVADIPAPQFELFCAAYLENDLQSESKAELHEIINSAPERRRTFELMSRTKLQPLSIVYEHKNLLIRTTPLRRVIRLAAIGLSSAAAIVLLVIIFQSTTRSLRYNTANSAQIFPSYPELKEQYFEIRAGSAIKIHPQGIVRTEKRYVPVQTYTSKLTEPDSTETNSREISIAEEQVTPIPPVAINLSADLGLSQGNSAALITANYPVAKQIEVVEMSNVARFVTKFFREKILHEKVARETPLKGYEIAEAGVAGLNLLFGWEMALNEKNDENGELTSVSFSSKILKFNAPVKKTEKQ